MTSIYPFREIEEKWQARWRERNLFATPGAEAGKKFYYLDMFPYPSGELHMGHVRNYVIGDCIARQKVMRGFRVLHPIGWDAFGLPAENAAIQHQTHPRQWTQSCIASMRRQIQRLGISYDWSREIDTSHPDYYRWTQWIFVQLFRNGLAYKKDSPVNWCPSCATVLANEQVQDGLCERCDSVVTRKTLPQWFFRTTAYAQRLLDDLELLDPWPERVRVMQRNWFGRSEGVEIDFILESGEKLPVFTTRVDTIYGATYVVLAPEHPLTQEPSRGTEQETAVRAFVERVASMSEMDRTAEGGEKEGVFIGAWAVNPMNGERIPIYTANYVLVEYGAGAIMAVPAHDQRDLDFARKLGLRVRVVIQPPGTSLDPETMTEAWVAEGIQANSGPFDGLPSERAKDAMADYMEAHGIGRRRVQYKLRDWCISRQRYWGAPIPIITCDHCGPVAVPEDQLPVLLPDDVDLSQSGRSPLTTSDGFVSVACPECGRPARREVDTMDTFVDSSWYFLRFVSPHASDGPFDREAVRQWLPVDKYVGGIEHAVLHLYYSRFITKVLQDLGHFDFPEPFTELFTQGMVVKGGAKMSKSKGNVVSPDAIIERFGADALRLFILSDSPPDQDLEWSDAGVAGAYRFLNRVYQVCRVNREHFLPNWRDELGRVGSSEGPNGVAPKARGPIRPTGGPDASSGRIRPLHAIGGIGQDGRDGEDGSRRTAPGDEWDEDSVRLRRKLHQTLAKVTGEIEARTHFNTAISALWELTNALRVLVEGGLSTRARCLAFSEAVENLSLILSPFCPYLADELWEMLGPLGRGDSVYEQVWPGYSPAIARDELVEIPVQINGKNRDRIIVSAEISEEDLRQQALALPRIQGLIEGKDLKRVIVVPGRLVNIVAS